MRYIFLFALLGLSACAHQESVNVVSDEYPVCPETTENNDGTVTFNLCYVLTENDYKEKYLIGLSYLHLYGERSLVIKEHPYDEFEFVAVSVNPSFATRVGIILFKHRDNRDIEPMFGPRDQYILLAHIWDDYGESQNIADDTTYRQAVVKKYYEDGINTEEYNSVYARIREGGFAEEVQPPWVKNSCTDGTFYYIEASVEGGPNFIGRHSCDQGYAENFSYAHPLFELAARKFPEIAALLGATRKEIDEESFQPLLSVD